MSKSKQIIVVKSKHDTEHYDASNEKSLANSLNQIFQNNKSMEYYFMLETKEFKKWLTETEKEIQKLEDLLKVHGQHRDYEKSREIKAEILELKKEIVDTKKQKELYENAKKGNIPAITQLLNLRRDYEYEGFNYAKLL